MTEPGAFATATCPPLCSDGSHFSPVSTRGALLGAGGAGVVASAYGIPAAIELVAGLQVGSAVFFALRGTRSRGRTPPKGGAAPRGQPHGHGQLGATNRRGAKQTKGA